MEFLAGLAALEEQLYGVQRWWIGAADVGHEGVWQWTHSMQVAGGARTVLLSERGKDGGCPGGHRQFLVLWLSQH